jgi:hypothetical protein
MTISSWNNLFFLLFLNLLNQLGNINKSINTLFDFFPAEKPLVMSGLFFFLNVFNHSLIYFSFIHFILL